MSECNEALKRIVGQANELGYIVVPASILQNAADQVAHAVDALRSIQQKYQETQDLLVELLVVIDGSEGESIKLVRDLISASVRGSTDLPGDLGSSVG